MLCVSNIVKRDLRHSNNLRTHVVTTCSSHVNVCVLVVRAYCVNLLFSRLCCLLSVAVHVDALSPKRAYIYMCIYIYIYTYTHVYIYIYIYIYYENVGPSAHALDSLQDKCVEHLCAHEHVG